MGISKTGCKACQQKQVKIKVYISINIINIISINVQHDSIFHINDMFFYL